MRKRDLLGFVGDGEFGEIYEGWEELFCAFFNKVFVKAEIIGFDGEVDDGGIRLIGLNED